MHSFWMLYHKLEMIFKKEINKRKKVVLIIQNGMNNLLNLAKKILNLVFIKKKLI